MKSFSQQDCPYGPVNVRQVEGGETTLRPPVGKVVQDKRYANKISFDCFRLEPRRVRRLLGQVAATPGTRFRTRQPQTIQLWHREGVNEMSELGRDGPLLDVSFRNEQANASDQVMSRRRFFRTAAGTTGLALASGAWWSVLGCGREEDRAQPVESPQSRPERMKNMGELKPVDAVEVTLAMDNFIDYLIAGAEGVRRFPLAYDAAERDQLVAEHGFSALVTVEVDGARSTVLYDGGLTPKGLVRNLDVMEVNPRHLRAIALSHGHFDHYAGLEGLFARHGRRKLPLVIHPEAWRERKIVFPTGAEIRMPAPSKADLEREGLDVIQETGPTLLLDRTVLISGQVERVSGFEKGFPAHYARAGEGWTPDPLILDDQNLIVNVRDRGLVVVSGCSHSGAVNVLHNARRLTGEQRIAGFIGGFHLTGGLFEPIIGPTVDAFVTMGVSRVVPAHCTGWKAVHLLARRMPEAFVQPSVGTVLRF
jgi:7,8-dihydropterin-6-yl-methyl-4-(beta-D-ribofuranosyl)aminobenzene 5'-phosphate synthase